MRDSLFETLSTCPVVNLPRLYYGDSTSNITSDRRMCGARSRVRSLGVMYAEQEEIEMLTKICVLKAIEAIASFVHEHHGHLTVTDVAHLTIALREQSYFECVIGVPGLYSIDVGASSQIARVRTYPGLLSNELTNSLIARILDGNT